MKCGGDWLSAVSLHYSYGSNIHTRVYVFISWDIPLIGVIRLLVIDWLRGLRDPLQSVRGRERKGTTAAAGLWQRLHTIGIAIFKDRLSLSLSLFLWRTIMSAGDTMLLLLPPSSPHSFRSNKKQTAKTRFLGKKERERERERERDLWQFAFNPEDRAEHKQRGDYKFAQRPISVQKKKKARMPGNIADYTASSFFEPRSNCLAFLGPKQSASSSFLFSFSLSPLSSLPPLPQPHSIHYARTK